ncbi:MAG: hypothetical protein NT007_07035 [Candidatus Kapabacteria bacterium]|nr:hypothetical protein [Candidatus Kapabacteria bacterium]
MKTILVILAFIPTLIFGQDRIDPPKLYLLDTASVVDRNWSGFMRGWNWGCYGQKLDSALHINFYHYGTLTDSFNKYIRIIQPLTGAGYTSDNIYNCRSLYLEPTITVDTSGGYIPRIGDSTHSIFGWLNKVGHLESFGNKDFGRLILNKDSITPGTKVLYNAWKADIFTWQDFTGCNGPILNNSYDSTYFHPFNGKQLYLTVNLRAIDSAKVDSLINLGHSSDTVLLIIIPYTLFNDTLNTNITDTVKFDGIPEQNSSYNDSIMGSMPNDFRGYYRKLNTSLSSQPKSMAITVGMLKSGINNNGNNSITLSAFARFDAIPFGGGYKNNPIFVNERKKIFENPYNVHEYITKIDIQVYYYGVVSVGLDYIRFETPRAQTFFRGAYDDSIRKNVKSIIDQTQANSSHLKLFRIYGCEEQTPSMFAEERYLNMLLDTLDLIEIGIDRSQVELGTFQYNVGMKNIINGGSLSFHGIEIGAPYIKQGKNDGDYRLSTMGLFSGKNGNDVLTFHPEKSDYEAYINAQGQSPEAWFPFNSFRDLPLSYYDSAWSNTGHSIYNQSTQVNIEKVLYQFYYKNKLMLFSESDWYVNIWQSPEIQTHPTDTVEYAGRVITGDEQNILLNSILLLGGKGFSHYFKTTLVNTNTLVGLQKSVDINYQNHLKTGDSLIYDDYTGEDYINLNDTIIPWSRHFLSSNYDFNALGVDENHLYAGAKSIRTATYKIHSYTAIPSVEQTLMSLHLQSWLAKGFHKWILTDPKLPDKGIEKYIDTANIKTRPLGRINTVNGKIEPYYEQTDIDSGFYDITILRNKADNSMSSNTFYMAVVNRRVDPLFRFNETFQIWPEDPNMEPCDVLYRSDFTFIPTAEFDEKVQNGGYYHLDNTIDCNGPVDSLWQDAAWWKDKWNRRQGIREITIPLKYNTVHDTNVYYLFHITELGNETSEFQNFFWKQNGLAHNIDTTIGQDRKLVIRLNPGEGKILKFERLEPGRMKGNLEYSNQAKLVQAPVLDSNGNETDSIRYHAAYYKFDYVDNRNKIYYQRSSKIHKSDSKENIVWENINGICVSDTIYDLDGVSTMNVACIYPSIVVRKDGNKQKAYIVFSCDSGLTHPYSRIAETIIEVDQQNLTVNYGHSLIRFEADHPTKEYGTPVISAASTGNYYAWSDKNMGIVAGFKYPNDIYFKDTVLINSNNFPNMSAGLGKHPALNSYSFSDNFKMDNSALVFQQPFYFGTYLQYNQLFSILNLSSHIIYTRLQYSDSTLKYYLQNDSAGFATSGFVLNTPKNLSIISLDPSFYNNAIKNSMPHIAREVILPGNSFGWIDSLYLCNDMISWTKSPTINKNNTIHILSLANWEFITGSTRTGLIRSSRLGFVNSNQDSIADAHLTQGPINLGMNYNATDTSRHFMLDFTKYGNGSGVNNIGVLGLNYYSFVLYSNFDQGFFNLTKWLNNIPIGRLSHLAQHKQRVDYTNSWLNRRIFEINSSDPPDILSSAKYFYKTLYDDGPNPMFGFESDSLSYYITQPLLNGDWLKMKFPYHSVEDSVLGNIIERYKCDTIYSEWFQVPATSTLQFMCKGTILDSNLLYMLIEKLSDSTYINIPIPKYSSDSTGIFRNYDLINGLSDYYRLAFITTDSIAQYSEQLQIDDLPTPDTMAKIVYRNNHIVIDLNSFKNNINTSDRIQLNIYPNPADNIIYAVAYLPVSAYYGTENRQNSKFKIRFYSLIGIEQFCIDTKPGEIKSILTETLQEGLYLIKVEEIVENPDWKPYTPVIQSLMISR